ncbi:MAG: hypothetical protein IH859_08230, partial [Chloroflexi bacterium]|nr:hypothetical protein [Chloroflexota bacterium]
SVFGTLLAVGIAFPGMLMAWWLLFPATVERAADRVESTPWRCFGLGIPAAIAVFIPFMILISIPVPFAKFLVAITLFTSFGFAGLGAAGIAAKMGKHLQNRSNSSLSESGAFVRGAVALELAAAFPLVGWMLVIPLTLITSLGAATFAILRWAPKPSDDSPPLPEVSVEPIQA